MKIGIALVVCGVVLDLFISGRPQNKAALCCLQRCRLLLHILYLVTHARTPSFRLSHARSLSLSFLPRSFVRSPVQPCLRLGHGWERHFRDDSRRTVPGRFGRFRVRPLYLCDSQHGVVWYVQCGCCHVGHSRLFRRKHGRLVQSARHLSRTRRWELRGWGTEPERCRPLGHNVCGSGCFSRHIRFPAPSRWPGRECSSRATATSWLDDIGPTRRYKRRLHQILFGPEPFLRVDGRARIARRPFRWASFRKPYVSDRNYTDGITASSSCIEQ